MCDDRISDDRLRQLGDLTAKEAVLIVRELQDRRAAELPNRRAAELPKGADRYKSGETAMVGDVVVKGYDGGALGLVTKVGPHPGWVQFKDGRDGANASTIMQNLSLLQRGPGITKKQLSKIAIVCNQQLDMIESKLIHWGVPIREESS